ncbi:hypothetical protein P691DRAFT_682297, partial [Macrolepiota fuliginosa MF-IS2]
YHEFVEAVLVNAMPFYPITRDIFVTQGWDTRNSQSTGKWHHIQLDWNQSSIEPICYCATAQTNKSCVHQQFLKEYGTQIFEETSGMFIEFKMI